MRKNIFKDWNVENLQNEIDKIVKFASDLYNYNYNNCSVTFNNRLKRAYAQVYYETGKIEVSNFLVNDYPDDVVIAVLIHEVCHALSYQYDINGNSGKNHNHDKIFKTMCKELCKGFKVFDSSPASQNYITRDEYIKIHCQGYSKEELMNIFNSITITSGIPFEVKRILVDTLFIKSLCIFNHILILDSS